VEVYEEEWFWESVTCVVKLIANCEALSTGAVQLKTNAVISAGKARKIAGGKRIRIAAQRRYLEPHGNRALRGPRAHIADGNGLRAGEIRRSANLSGRGRGSLDRAVRSMCRGIGGR